MEPIEQDVHRSTRFLGGWKLITVHRISKRAGVRSRYKYPGICHGTRDLSKNHDKQLTFIDRVGFSDFLSEFLIQILSWLKSQDSENNRVHYILVQAF